MSSLSLIGFCHQVVATPADPPRPTLLVPRLGGHRLSPPWAREVTTLLIRAAHEVTISVVCPSTNLRAKHKGFAKIGMRLEKKLKSNPGRRKPHLVRARPI